LATVPSPILSAPPPFVHTCDRSVSTVSAVAIVTVFVEAESYTPAGFQSSGVPTSTLGFCTADPPMHQRDLLETAIAPLDGVWPHVLALGVNRKSM